MRLFHLGRPHTNAEFLRVVGQLSSLASDMERIRDGMSPQELVDTDVPLLDTWSVGLRSAQCLLGQSTGHPRLIGENRPIATSDLWLMSSDFTWARTLSRWYRLGRSIELPGSLQ